MALTVTSAHLVVAIRTGPCEQSILKTTSLCFVLVFHMGRY